MFDKLFIHMSVVAVLVMGSVSYAETTADATESKKVSCPTDNNDEYVVYPDPNSCSNFYKCDYGVPIMFECPEGLHFNPEIEACDWPANAGCEQQ